MCCVDKHTENRIVLANTVLIKYRSAFRKSRPALSLSVKRMIKTFLKPHSFEVGSPPEAVVSVKIWSWLPSWGSSFSQNLKCATLSWGSSFSQNLKCAPSSEAVVLVKIWSRLPSWGSSFSQNLKCAPCPEAVVLVKIWSVQPSPEAVVLVKIWSVLPLLRQ